MNNDLISRSALLEALNKLYMAALRKTAHSVETIYELDHLSMLVKDAPAVDAEVVRCRECKHYSHAVISDDPAEVFEVDVCVHKDLFPTRVTQDFFCAHGERKMDAEVEG